MEILNQENFGDDKVLRSLTTKFEHGVTVIEEFKDLSTYSFNELMSSLLAHEDRINRSLRKFKRRHSRLRGKFGYKGKAENSARHGHGRAAEVETKLVNSVSTRAIFNVYTVRNLSTKKLTVGRSRKMSRRKLISLKMWKKKFPNSESANVVWFIDRGCSNHMSSSKSLFRDLDESQTSENLQPQRFRGASYRRN
uniref:Uncharacterized protein n=1 Tax=Solanum lycopersicum TaxID=4081 RepID=A0A3Q7IJQ3_SOLLC